MDYSILLPEEEKQPGEVHPQLRKRMGVALADLFDEHGPQIYSSIVSSLKKIAVKAFSDGIDDLEAAVESELGNRGLEESKKHIRDWMESIVEDVLYYGINELALALGNMANDLVAEYIQDDVDDVSPSDIDDLLPSINMDSDIPEEVQDDLDETEEEEKEEEEGLIG